MPKRSKRQDTKQGFGPAEVGASQRASEPMDPQVASFEHDPSAKPSSSSKEATKARRPQPAVDIDLINEHRTAPLSEQTWTFVEVWTQNTIYELDSNLRCIAVVSQATRKLNDKHALLGARLVGGQSRDGESMQLSHPFPRPGSEAVFEQVKGRQARFSQTSTVVRVVMRLRTLTVSNDHLLPAWEGISSQQSDPPEPPLKDA